MPFARDCPYSTLSLASFWAAYGSSWKRASLSRFLFSVSPPPLWLSSLLSLFSLSLSHSSSCFFLLRHTSMRLEPESSFSLSPLSFSFRFGQRWRKNVQRLVTALAVASSVIILFQIIDFSRKSRETDFSIRKYSIFWRERRGKRRRKEKKRLRENEERGGTALASLSSTTTRHAAAHTQHN